ncbi:hypothetical protein GCM10022399_40060 [Terrabacter ginsenosidimutans]|uniref:Uncharacterized protein n=1 Tax=Terrabacter ginsenosidimutans TaxID=490575 RepID=A0ABP7EIA2_9MICO
MTGWRPAGLPDPWTRLCISTFLHVQRPGERFGSFVALAGLALSTDATGELAYAVPSVRCPPTTAPPQTGSGAQGLHFAPPLLTCENAEIAGPKRAKPR